MAALLLLPLTVAAAPVALTSADAEAWLRWLLPLPKQVSLASSVELPGEAIAVQAPDQETVQVAVASLRELLGPVGEVQFTIRLALADPPELAGRPNAAQGYRLRPDGDDALVATRTAAQEQAEMERLTARLAQQMEKQPDRVDGWLLLGRSLRTLENYDEASRAFERALALTGRAPDVLSEYGEILVLAHGGRVAEPAKRVFEETLKAAPAEPRARYYLGLAKAQQGDPRAALQDWVDLIAMSPPDAPWLADIRREIQGVATAAGIDAETLAPSAGLSAPAAPGPSAEDAKAAAEMSPAERDAMIRGMVEGLAARLEDQPGDADGWRRLARAYEVLGEPEKAKDALAQAEAAERKARP